MDKNLSAEAYSEKVARLDAAEADPRLKRRRFVFSGDPVFREKLSVLQKEANALCAQYPELVGIQLFGSHSKGYPGPESDFDLGVAFDNELLIRAQRKPEDLVSVITTHLSAVLGASAGKINIEPYRVSKQPVPPDSQYALFFLSLGDGVRPYRDAVITALERSPDGEKQWERIMSLLWERENLSFTGDLPNERKKLYPWKLSEARAYFLRDGIKDEVTLAS